MGVNASMSLNGSLPKVAVLIPQPMRQSILSPDAEKDLASFATVVSGAAPEELPELLDGAVACVTGWGTPPLTDEVLQASSGLRLVAHTAGSIHKLVPAAALARGLRVSHAAAIIADSVAELVLGQALRFLRNLDAIDREMKAGAGWMEIRNAYPGRLLGEQTVGVVGTGYVGRKVIQGFQAFGCRVLVSDPLLSDAQASELGVTKVELPELFASSTIVSLHAPALPETVGLVNAELLRLMPDGALLINTSRGSLVDEEALLAELASGRIAAVLDVFRTEPLPADSPFRSLPNVFLSPHAAGHTIDTHWRQGQAMVDEVRRLLANEPLRYEIAPERLATMA
jgi:phosphoglycerate dehydrogenase-like enzyme